MAAQQQTILIADHDSRLRRFVELSITRALAGQVRLLGDAAAAGPAPLRPLARRGQGRKENAAQDDDRTEACLHVRILFERARGHRKHSGEMMRKS